jgi:hypothetical protein
VNEIKQIKEEKIYMNKPNYLSRDEIIGILKKYSTINKKKYKVLSILKYNIDLEPGEIKYFLSNKKEYTNTFVNVIKNIDSIPWKKTISMFQDLNNLFIIFYENEDKSNKHANTKKIFLNRNIINSHKKTYIKTI